jgi:site-specific recombinase XerD
MPDNLLRRYIKPTARKVGINKNIGWHTFRHSFGTILKANGERCEDDTGAFETRE